MNRALFVLVALPMFSEGSTLSVTATPVQAPASCHIMAYKSNVVTGGQAKPYFSSINENYRADIVCIGDTLEINEPIYSNGGDVVIWASTVKINAPIDTRVHIDHAGLDYFENGEFPANPPSVFPTDIMLQPKPREDARYMKSFIEYYTRCIDCINISKSVWIPRAPSGIVPGYAFDLKVKDGLKTFDKDLNFDTLKSGNTYIISSNVEISTNLKTPIPPPNLPACNTTEKINYVPYAVNAKGITGGNGGAGSPSTCTNYLKRKFDCFSHYFLESGKSGPGGKGGNAGNINFIKIGSPWGSSEITALQSVSSVAGGDPGERKSYFSPTARGDYSATGNYCDFRRKTSIDYPASETGQFGVLSFSSMDAGSALNFVGQLISVKDARFDYDLGELAKRASLDKGISNVTFDDYLVSRLGDLLGKAELNLVEALRAVVLNDTFPPENSFSPASFQIMDTEEISTMRLSGRAKIISRQLSNFSPQENQMNILTSYLMAVGGILNISDTNPLETFRFQALRTEISTQTKILEDLHLELNGIGKTLAEIDIRSEKKERMTALAGLQNQVREASELLEQQHELEKVGHLGKILGQVGTSAGKVYASYQSGAPTLLVESIGGLASSMDQLRAYLVDNNSDSQSLALLQNKLKILQKEYEDFMGDISNTRRSHNESRIMTLESSLLARGNLAGKLESRHIQFNNLLGASYASYLENPTSAGKIKFENNLDSLKVFIEQYPMKEPAFDISSINIDCGKKPLFFRKGNWRCTELSMQTYSQAIVHPHLLTSGTVVDIPLYVLSSRNSGRYVTFKLPVNIRPLDYKK
ncbi:hypothetical protein [Pseudomonas azerbaijanorientalis]|uniref:hypothetical protein n=1 Tax=Pseudomonas azerbaijanorientalis TaxID=2842350 RepID=UPI001C3E7136|nr:hypothetical protein [Pseudomonas azerbaijanorientalis]QXH64235.1 hypothetical protein KSS91_12470 [Pseudomonas azerbaijanorientalis]